MANYFKLKLEDKPKDITSFSSLGKTKREFRGEKVGHAGTLDKFAEGLMIIMIGSATKLNPVFSSFSKKYIATIEFGDETSTLDPEGEVVASAPVPTFEALKAAVDSFIGPQMQVPPLYSALHVDGKRAYEMARSGKEVEMEARPIEIYSIELLSYDGKVARVECHVSKGTYIRSLARDIAIKCGSRAHLIELKRTQVGPFTLDDVNLTTRELLDKTDLFSTIHLDSKFKKEIDNGWVDKRAILSDSDKSKEFSYLYFGDEFYGIGEKSGKLKVIMRGSDGNL
ncbi:MAG: tRNA pseudouridine(55) synthase TruB [Spirochaetales bacterium]|nr:tRNA pseudouridine(55) synthase TruB [Spirochaetales bacterium]